MGLNWRRELLLLSMAGMDASWLAGWAVILLGAGQTAGLATAWLSTFALYVMATTTARTLIRRRTQRSDWIIGGLVFVSTLVFINLNLYPHNGPFDPSWLRAVVEDFAAGSRRLPRELVGLFIGFFIWFQGLRLPRRPAGIRTMAQQFQIGLALIVGLAMMSTRFPVSVGGVIATYFATSLLSLALTRIEETARTEGGAASPFGRKWLMTLAGALLAVGAIALVGRLLFTVETVRALLRPLALAAAAVVTAFGLLLAILVQYLLFPIILRLFGGRISGERLELQQPQVFQQQEVEGTTRLLIRPEVLHALRVAGLFLLVLIALWLVVRSFRRWRSLPETAGGARETARPDSSLADDVLGYLRDRWQRLREMADIRRLLQLRGAASIRAIYANLLALMAAADYPRQAGQTPYEFEPTVAEVLPARETEISSITNAYVRARYGEQDVSDDELEGLREAWRLVRADGERLVEGKPVVKTSK
ncbi:MAG: DUF4129 domain-containing protein [Anaerolineae bacterium]